MRIRFTDNVLTTLATGISNVDTQLTVAAGTGTRFPSVSSGDGYFIITMEDAAGNREFIRCDHRATDLMGSGPYPLQRGYGGSTARAWLAGDSVDLRWHSVAAAALFSEDVALTGIVSPAQITANQNDYAPTGLAAAAIMRISTDASRNITGLGNGAAGKVLVVHNVGAFNAVLVDESASSTAANRFALRANFTIPPDGSVLLQYDSTSSRWRLIGKQTSTFFQTLEDAVDGAAVRSAISAAASGANTDVTSVYLNNTGLKVKDTNATHGLSIVPGSDLTADRTLTITTGDANRALTLSGDATINGTNTGDQSAATQAEQETGSSTSVFVSPGRQQYHASACKGWVNCGVSANITASYNVSGVTDAGAGVVWVSWATDFSSGNHATVATVDTSSNLFANTNVLQAGIDVIESRNSGSGALTDPTLYSIVAFGDQA